MQFIVHDDGNISDLKALTKNGYGMEDEVIRLLKLSPKWKPAMSPDPLRFSSLDDAKRNLIQELDDFELYFKNNPDATFIQPRLGSLNYQEWIILHDKHFTHHFKQFDLL